ncbi:hypothetical protein [Agromyces sp. Root81]|uniref:hypothetical protein n=1 Tax=Agromyces sp. Root81 TaxID=1736601 RepID=UPI001F387212|nr:hypothetical protein [Agromyces sp. Root81]
MGENVGAFVRECLALLVTAQAAVASHAVQVDERLSELADLFLEFEHEPFVGALQVELRSVGA